MEFGGVAATVGSIFLYGCCHGIKRFVTLDTGAWLLLDSLASLIMICLAFLYRLETLSCAI